MLTHPLSYLYNEKKLLRQKLCEVFRVTEISSGDIARHWYLMHALNHTQHLSEDSITRCRVIKSLNSEHSFKAKYVTHSNKSSSKCGEIIFISVDSENAEIIRFKMIDHLSYLFQFLPTKNHYFHWNSIVFYWLVTCWIASQTVFWQLIACFVAVGHILPLINAF